MKVVQILEHAWDSSLSFRKFQTVHEMWRGPEEGGYVQGMSHMIMISQHVGSSGSTLDRFPPYDAPFAYKRSQLWLQRRLEQMSAVSTLRYNPLYLHADKHLFAAGF